MDIEQLKKNINEYFEYIKMIYINEFKKYMTTETLETIQAMTDVFEFNEDLTFKIIIDKKIIINLNLKKFVEENRLKEESLSDLTEENKRYVNYILKNEDNVYELIKNQLVSKIVAFFTNTKSDVVAIGTNKLLEEILVNKYNLSSEKIITSKEKEVALYIKEVVGEDILFSSVINQDMEMLKSNYDLYSDAKNNNYETFINHINKMYKEYSKKISKVFFTDSLYEYQTIDYKLSEKLGQIRDEKKNVNMSRLKRLSSLKFSILEMKKNEFIFNALERRLLDNALIEVDKIISRLHSVGKEKLLENINKEYPKILEIEQDLTSHSVKVWNNYLTRVSYYKIGSDFNFLIGPEQRDKIIETTLISSEHLKKIKTLKNTVGFIYEPLEDGLIYAASNEYIYKELDKENYKENYNTLFVNGQPIEIDRQDDSKVVAPQLILRENLRDKNIKNKIILDSHKARKVGIYCFVEDNLEESFNYNKALELSENYELPIIPISKNHYFKGQAPTKIEVKMEPIEEKKETFFGKIKKSIYEEQITEFKKTL